MTESSPVLSSLNQIQRDIVTYGDGPMLVLAGAGSGKTRAVTHKIAYLLKEQLHAPYRVLAMTFTNKAAGEMRDRVRKLVGPPADGLELGTFHSVCSRFLRRHATLLGYSSNYVIYDPSDCVVLMRHVVKDRNLDPKRFAARGLISTLDSLRSRDRDLDKWAEYGRSEGQPWRETAVSLFHEFTARKQALDAMDFSDLLYRMRDLLQDHEDVRNTLQERFEYVLVDEMQDTNKVQMDLLRLLVGTHNRIAAVGDDDQSIYGWRGAKIDNMLNFEATFPGTRIIRMEQNYRSTRTILAAANSVIDHNKRRHVKKLWTDNDQGDKLKLICADSEGDEAVRVAKLVTELYEKEEIPRRRMAVFFRTNAQSRSFEEVFAQHQIPHIVVGGMRFYERAEVKDALAYLRVVSNPKDEVSLMRIVNKPTRGIGATSLQRLRDLSLRQGCSMYESAQALAAQEQPERWARPIIRFVGLVEVWRGFVNQMTVPDLAMRILDDAEYLERLRTQDDVEAESRLENLEQLLASMTEFDLKNDSPRLQEYLEQVALITDLDLWRDDQDYIPLMTVHAAKGLEFDVVFASGMEQELFPHKSHMEGAELEEERRLFYVALTRARKQVYVSHARSRARFGQWEFMKPSIFVTEIAPEFMEETASRRRGSFSGAMGRGVHRRPAVPVKVKAAGVTAEWAGEVVRHAQHGRGRVVAVVGSDTAAQVVVKFDSGSLVTLTADSLKLTT